MTLFILALTCAAVGGIAGAFISKALYPNTAIYVTFDRIHKDDVDDMMQAVHDGATNRANDTTTTLGDHADHGPHQL